MVKKTALGTDIQFMDTHSPFVDKKNFVPDKVHPCSIGANIIAKAVYENIYTHVYPTATPHKINFTLVPSTSPEYRSLPAGWEKGSSWKKQHQMINELYDQSKDIDILFIGNSITQSWGSPYRKIYGTRIFRSSKVF